MKFLFLTFLVFLLSCANYVKKMHQDFDRQDKKRAWEARARKEGLFKHYQEQRVTSAGKRVVSPRVKRHYKNRDERNRRFRAKDLDDNRAEGSLWSNGGGGQSFLFSKEKIFGVGDIVLLQVQGRLKGEISSELKRVIGNIAKKNKAKKAKGSEKASEKPTPAPAPASTVSEGSGDKVQDVISSIVINEVNNNHLLLKGRKQLLFENRKRLIEVQALVGRYDIEPDGTLLSNRIIEHQIQVVR